MYTRILVPLDGSPMAEQVLPYVKALATGLKTPVVLMRTFETVPPEMADPPRGRYLDQVLESFRCQAQDYLDGVRVSLKNAGAPVSTVTREGDAGPLIIQEAARETDTLIAMSTHGRGGIGRWVMGSITDKMLHATRNPLLVVRSNDHGTSRVAASLTSIIVPLDGSPLAEQIIPHVVALAGPLGLKVLLVQVIPGPESYWGYGEFPTSIATPPAGEMSTRALEYLGKVQAKLHRLGVTQVDMKVLEGGAASSIIDLARVVSDNLVAITTHGRSGMGRWVLGSVADRVVRYSGDPVLLVRSSQETPA